MAISRRQLCGKAIVAATVIGASPLIASGYAYPQSSDTSTSPAGQASKQDAQYQDKPNGQQSCSQCANFLPPSGCEVVSGSVAPNGWCKLFKAKSS